MTVTPQIGRTRQAHYSRADHYNAQSHAGASDTASLGTAFINHYPTVLDYQQQLANIVDVVQRIALDHDQIC
jgi:hypothetical protein